MIRLVSVVGHGVNLLPHFIEHYQPYVDEIQLVIYETDKYPLLADEVSEIISSYNNVHIVKVHKDRIFDWERVTILYNYVTNKEPNDWWIIADIDLFSKLGRAMGDFKMDKIDNKSNKGILFTRDPTTGKIKNECIQNTKDKKKE